MTTTVAPRQSGDSVFAQIGRILRKFGLVLWRDKLVALALVRMVADALFLVALVLITPLREWMQAQGWWYMSAGLAALFVPMSTYITIGLGCHLFYAPRHWYRWPISVAVITVWFVWIVVLNRPVWLGLFDASTLAFVAVVVYHTRRRVTSSGAP